MLAGLEVVLGSTVRGERGSPAGWARGFRVSSTFTSYLTLFVYSTDPLLDRFPGTCFEVKHLPDASVYMSW